MRQLLLLDRARLQAPGMPPVPRSQRVWNVDPKEARKLDRAAMVIRKAIAQRAGPETREIMQKALGRIERHRNIGSAARKIALLKIQKEERRAGKRQAAADKALRVAARRHGGEETRKAIDAAIRRFHRQP